MAFCARKTSRGRRGGVTFVARRFGGGSDHLCRFLRHLEQSRSQRWHAIRLYARSRFSILSNRSESDHMYGSGKHERFPLYRSTYRLRLTFGISFYCTNIFSCQTTKFIWLVAGGRRHCRLPFMTPGRDDTIEKAIACCCIYTWLCLVRPACTWLTCRLAWPSLVLLFPPGFPRHPTPPPSLTAYWLPSLLATFCMAGRLLLLWLLICLVCVPVPCFPAPLCAAMLPAASYAAFITLHFLCICNSML